MVCDKVVQPVALSLLHRHTGLARARGSSARRTCINTGLMHPGYRDPLCPPSFTSFQARVFRITSLHLQSFDWKTPVLLLPIATGHA